MFTKKELADLNWQHECDKNCFVPYPHSHHFILGRDPNETCSKCGREMKLEAQVYGNEFAQNTAVLYNAYECACGHKSEQILYKGRPRAYREIYSIAEERIAALTLNS